MKKVSSKQKKYLVYISVAIVVIVLLWFLIKRRKQMDSSLPDYGVGPGGSQNSTPKKAYNDNTVFSNKSPMMKDERVKEMQQMYDEVAGFYGWNFTIGIDSVYGSDTTKAMRKWLGKPNVSYNEVLSKYNEYKALIGS